MSIIASILIVASTFGGADVSLRVDLSTLPSSDSKRVEAYIRQDAGDVLESAGHRLVDGAPHVIAVVVSYYGDDDANTLIRVRLDSNEVVELRCELCANSKWLAQLEGEITRLSALIGEQEQVNSPVAVVPDTASSQHPPESTPESPDSGTDEPRRMTWLGGAGIGLGIGGAGFLVAGSVGLAASPQRATDRDATKEQLTTSSRKRDTTFAVIGGLAVVAGVTMIAVDIKRQRRLTLHPSIGLTWTGLHVRGNF